MLDGRKIVTRTHGVTDREYAGIWRFESNCEY